MPSPKRHYVGAWTDSDRFETCGHEHKTMACAVACAGSVIAGAYVVAVQNGEFEELDPWEEMLFQKLMYENPERLERLIRWFHRMHLILT